MSTATDRAVEGIAEVMRRPDRAKDPENPHQRRRLRYAAEIVEAIRTEPKLRDAVAEIIRGEKPSTSAR